MQTTSNALLLAGFATLLAACATTVLADDLRRFSTDPKTQAVTLSVDGKACWTYVPQGKEGKPYFHPLTLPGTGESLTSHRPPDHDWHLGLWFSWKYINGVNFWEPDSNAVTRVVSQAMTPAEDASFRADAVLAYLAKGKEVVHEQRTVKVTTQPNGNYTIDWDSTFTALDSEAVFDCTPAKKGKDGTWSAGGYAGFMWRFTDGTAFTYAFTNAAGASNVKVCGEKSERIEVIATSKASGAKAKITFRDNPENPRYPSPWFARHSTSQHNGRGYFLIGPTMIFHEPLKLPAGSSARFRYSVSVERL